MNYKPKSYTLGPRSLKEIMVELHLNYLHKTQLDMIDEAVLKSDWKESKEVLKHIMEKK
jgi:hypothetical protein